MAIQLSHKFMVWHPEDGLPVKFHEAEFVFTYPVSRTYARDNVERVQGYVIEKKPGKKRGITQRRVRHRKAKS